jgi:hypothetical protein
MRGAQAFVGGSALALLLGACSAGDAPAAGGTDGAENIACALGEGAQFAPVCGLERADRGGEKLYVVHHPDGGFRSFTVLANGAGLAAADGAEPATQTIAGNLLEVTVGEDRYRFPFKARP